MVFLVCFEMLGQVFDPLGEDGNLHLRRARIPAVRAMLLDELFLRVRSDTQRDSPLPLKFQVVGSSRPRTLPSKGSVSPQIASVVKPNGSPGI